MMIQLLYYCISGAGLFKLYMEWDFEHVSNGYILSSEKPIICFQLLRAVNANECYFLSAEFVNCHLFCTEHKCQTTGKFARAGHCLPFKF